MTFFGYEFSNRFGNNTVQKTMLKVVTNPIKLELD
jgi:hypothetical protein